MFLKSPTIHSMTYQISARNKSIVTNIYLVSAGPYQNTSAIGAYIANANNTMTNAEKLAASQTRVGEWLSSPGHPLVTYTAQQNIGQSTNNNG